MSQTKLESRKSPHMHEEKHWVLIDHVKALIQPLSLFVTGFGVTLLLGFWKSVEALYRPFANGPTTQQLTAVSIVLIGLSLISLVSNKNEIKSLFKVTVIAVIFVSILRIINLGHDINLPAFLNMIDNQMAVDFQVSKANKIGINSAALYLMIAISLLLYHFQKSISSQIVAFIALAIPTTSLTGYVYGLENFHGSMSLIATILGLIISACTLALTSHTGGLRAFLSPYHGGEISRLQALSGYLFPTLLGYFFVKMFDSTNGDMFGIYVVAISWFIILMISVSAFYVEDIDQHRRSSELILVEKAMNDPLTGLSNRRKFLEVGELEINRVKRNKNYFGLLIIDVDHFKKINDTAGHDMGDKVLIKLAEVLQNSVRNVDLVSRLGGEEFSIILVDTTAKGVKLVAEKIRNEIENTTVEGWTDQYGAITASIGCALNTGNCLLQQTIKLADSALYEAKRSGRNQVQISDVIDCRV